jgi:DNA-binding Lrp family transcriptional regulator
MDDLDNQIMKILRMDSRTTFVEIASQVDLSEAAIRRRVQNLLSEGIIKKFTIDETSTKVSTALVMVAVNSGTLISSISGKIKSFQGVRKVYEITGQYEIGVILDAPEIEVIRSTIENIRRLEGVEDTHTSMILRDLS